MSFSAKPCECVYRQLKVVALTASALTIVSSAALSDVGFPAVVQLSSLNGTTGFRIDGAGPDNQSGTSVASAGDVNGDGLDDIIIGALTTSFNAPASGSAYVVFGRTSGFPPVLSLADIDGSNGFRVDGMTQTELAGRSVAPAGDVNGDGFDDIIVSAYAADPAGFNSGSAYVVFGKSAAFSPSMNLSDVNGGNGFRIDGTDAFGIAGRYVGPAGDVNADGYADVIIGATNHNGLQGASFVIFGKPSGFPASMSASALNGSNGFQILGVESNSRSGTSVYSAGDMNGDGFDDVIIGTETDLSPFTYIVFGNATGYGPMFSLSALIGTNGFRFEEPSDAGTGLAQNRSRRTAGDVNSDGYDDVIIGSFDTNGAAGASFVIFGKSSPYLANLSYSDLVGTNGFRINGATAGDLSGISVGSAGDVNQDGFSDMIIAAQGTDYNGTNSGSGYVLYGKASGFAPALNLSSLDGTTGFRMDGVLAGDNAGMDVAGGGDFNGDGRPDLLVSAALAAPNGQQLAGSTYVVFGPEVQPHFTFIGFNNPMENLPFTNSVKAGSTAPVKWQLTDGNGEFVSDLSVVTSVQYVPVSCTASDFNFDNAIDAMEAGGAGLHYDSTTNEFVFPWKTSKSQAGTCAVFGVAFSDGSDQFARFRLK